MTKNRLKIIRLCIAALGATIVLASTCMVVAADISGQSFDYKTTANYEAGYKVIAPRSTPDPKQADFTLWLPARIKHVKALVAISRHGSGESFFADPQLRALAAKLQLGVVGFIGDGVQRGVAPGVLENALTKLGEQSQHPEIADAPIVTFGMSNGVGFSCGYACMCPERVLGWIAFHPGSDLLFSRQFAPAEAQQAVAIDPGNKWLLLNPPPLYSIPGLVVAGEADELAALSKGTADSPDGNVLLAVEKARREHNALVQLIVEPGVGHGHNGTKSWTIVVAFIDSVFRLRMPSGSTVGEGSVQLKSVDPASGWLGRNWDRKTSGGQNPSIMPSSTFSGDRSATSWLLNRNYALKWQAFCKAGSL